MHIVLPQTLPPGCSSPRRCGPRPFRKSLASCVVLASLATGLLGTANAGDQHYDFNGANGDPRANGFVLFGSNTNGWQTNGGFTGAEGDGFLEITPAVNGQTLGILFPLDYFTNADNSLTALPLKGFLLETDVRIGNATGNNGRPADGFSISFASSQDPIVFWGKQGQFRGWGGGDSAAEAAQPTGFNFATGVGAIDPQQCTAGTAENGTKTGVSVQFDTWQGNTIIDQAGVATAGNDNVGWRVHFNGKMIQRIQSQPPSGPLAQSPDPTGADVNGLAVCPAANAPTDFTQDTNCLAAVLADTNSIQTGPYYTDDNDGATHSGSFTNLGWAHLTVELTTNTPHLLTVTYKGRPLVDHAAITNFSPYVGQLVMGGRTGGANENRDIDNVHIITYPAVQSVYGGISSAGNNYLNDFSLLLQNIGPAKVNQITTLTLDGVDIKAAAGTTITIADPNTTIKYLGSTNFPTGSAHALVLGWSDAAGNNQTQNIAFTTVNWIVVPASASVPASSIDLNSAGFRVQASQVTGGEPNRMYWADEQLMGLHGTNHINFSLLTTVEGEISHNDVINYDISIAGGQFGNSLDWADFGIPGVDITGTGNAAYNNSAMSAMAYFFFPAAGTYVMGGNSDDGLRVTFAKNSHDLLGTRVPGMFADVGRGISAFENIGAVIITNVGYYGFRLLWENGGGGSSVEWYMTSTPAGVTNVLIGDVNGNPQTAVAVYQVSSAAPPYVSYAEPPLDDDQVNPDSDYAWKLTDGPTLKVASGSVVLKLNGVTMSPAISSASGVTTISLPHTPGTPHAPGTNVVDLSFKDDSNNNYAYNYSFVVGGFVAVPPSAGVPASAVDATKPGFNMVMYKVDQVGSSSIPNRFHVAEQILAGLWGPNKATGGGTFTVPGTINYDINFNAGGNNATDGDFNGDLPFPGLDGTGVAAHPVESYAVEFETWVVFPAEGTYQLGFNSDDGFRTQVGLTRPANIGQLTVLAPASIAGDKLAAWGSNRGDGPGTTPTTPVSGNLVLALGTTSGVDPTFGCSTNGFSNAAQVAGNIALVERGTCGFAEKAANAAAAGALACIIANNRPDSTPAEGWFPQEIVAGPAVSIPVVMIDITNYYALTNAMAAGTVTARLNPIDDSISVGESDIGRGASDTIYKLYIPQAGAYPLRTVYWQGGGGGNAEWFSVAADGTKVLLNSTNAGALATFRAATSAPPPPTASISRSGSNVIITYTGTLQSSITVNGGYADVPAATSPYTVPTGAAAAKFYRTH